MERSCIFVPERWYLDHAAEGRTKHCALEWDAVIAIFGITKDPKYKRTKPERSTFWSDARIVSTDKQGTPPDTFLPRGRRVKLSENTLKMVGNSVTLPLQPHVLGRIGIACKKQRSRRAS